jgi:hypothetical protein
MIVTTSRQQQEQEQQQQEQQQQQQLLPSVLIKKNGEYIQKCKKGVKELKQQTTLGSETHEIEFGDGDDDADTKEAVKVFA